MDIVGAGLGSALGGSLGSGAPVIDVARSWQGTIGFVTGYTVGSVVSNSNPDWAYAPIIAGAALPLILGGVVDRGLAGVVIGGLLGAVIGSNFFQKGPDSKGQ